MRREFARLFVLEGARIAGLFELHFGQAPRIGGAAEESVGRRQELVIATPNDPLDGAFFWKREAQKQAQQQIQSIPSRFDLRIRILITAPEVESYIHTQREANQ